MKTMGQPGLLPIGPYNRYSYENRCAIIAAKSSGLCPTQISSTFNIPIRTVRNILLSFESYSIVGRRPGSGRKKKTSKQDDDKIITTLKLNPRMTIDQFRVENPDIKLSKSSTKDRIRENGQLGSYIQRKDLFWVRKPVCKDLNGPISIKTGLVSNGQKYSGQMKVLLIEGAESG